MPPPSVNLYRQGVTDDSPIHLYLSRHWVTHAERPLSRFEPSTSSLQAPEVMINRASDCDKFSNFGVKGDRARHVTGEENRTPVEKSQGAILVPPSLTERNSYSEKLVVGLP